MGQAAGTGSTGRFPRGSCSRSMWGCAYWCWGLPQHCFSIPWGVPSCLSASPEQSREDTRWCWTRCQLPSVGVPKGMPQGDGTQLEPPPQNRARNGLTTACTSQRWERTGTPLPCSCRDQQALLQHPGVRETHGGVERGQPGTEGTRQRAPFPLAHPPYAMSTLTHSLAAFGAVVRCLEHPPPPPPL